MTPWRKRCVIGATCTLKDTKSGEVLTLETDAYGDFWFEGIGDSTYDLELKAGGKVEDLHRSGYHACRHQPGGYPAGLDD